MPSYACPNCGSSLSSAAAPPPAACPDCCATLRPAPALPLAEAVARRRPRRPAPILKLPILPEATAPTVARHALGELRDDLGDSKLATCELLVSELVTNVVLHGKGASLPDAADMRVRLYDDRVRVEVRDDGPGFSPHRRSVAVDKESGWGLHLVGELADAWGVELGVQNCVWFELDRTRCATAQPVAH